MVGGLYGLGVGGVAVGLVLILGFGVLMIVFTGCVFYCSGFVGVGLVGLIC